MFCGPQVKTVVVNATGDAGALFTDVDTCPGAGTGICEYEQIDASDSAGLRPVDKVVSPFGPAPALSELRLTGDVLSWSHSAKPMSVILR